MKKIDYEVYALRYAEHKQRSRNENFISSDEHDNSNMPLDFYLWLIKDGDTCILVDTGFNAEMAIKRNRHYHASPESLLAQLGINAEDIQHLIITHMHYDHIGNLAAFPNAVLYVQEKEMHYCTGRAMNHEFIRAPYDPDNIANAIYRLHAGKVRFVNANEEILPGVNIHHMGGHTDGMQIVSVNTERGTVILDSDAAHYWHHLRKGTPFPIVMSIPDMLTAHQRIIQLSSGPDHIIPGHDPAVRQRFPKWNDNPNIVQLHLSPRD
jgi:glyoxylase-like metal-dependent hydrolase (beta-lactamase superfamily II)